MDCAQERRGRASWRTVRRAEPPFVSAAKIAKPECCLQLRRIPPAEKLLAPGVRSAVSGGNMKFTNILYPVDFSERCRTVAPFVNAVAQRNGASLTLVNFVEVPALWYGTAEAPCVPDLSIARLVDDAREGLTMFAKEFFPCNETSGIHLEIRVEEGDPGSSIVAMARTSGVDLIMMPTRGHGLFRAALLGSVTAKVLHDSECPVWTAAHAGEEGDSPSTEWRNVVCAVDTTPDARRLLDYAKELASAYGAAVHLVHAVPSGPDNRPEKYLERDFDAFVKDSARKAIDAMQKEAGTNFRLCVEGGNVSSIVAAVAKEDKSDLVLIGRGVLSHFAGRLRTHVYAIIRDAPCPVLSV